MHQAPLFYVLKKKNKHSIFQYFTKKIPIIIRKSPYYFLRGANIIFFVLKWSTNIIFFMLNSFNLHIFFIFKILKII